VRNNLFEVFLHCYTQEREINFFYVFQGVSKSRILRQDSSAQSGQLIDDIFNVSIIAKFFYRKNKLAEESKILLDTDLKIIYIEPNNFDKTLKIMSNTAKT